MITDSKGKQFLERKYDDSLSSIYDEVKLLERYQGYENSAGISQ